MSESTQSIMHVCSRTNKQLKKGLPLLRLEISAVVWLSTSQVVEKGNPLK
jgi:hypothetical protein